MVENYCFYGSDDVDLAQLMPLRSAYSGPEKNSALFYAHGLYYPQFEYFEIGKMLDVGAYMQLYCEAATLKIENYESICKSCEEHCRTYHQQNLPKRQEDWCRCFPLVAELHATVSTDTVCARAKERAEDKAECEKCRKKPKPQSREITVSDLRLMGHPAKVFLRYTPIDCDRYRDEINLFLPGIHPVSKKSHHRFSVRLTQAINKFLIRNPVPWKCRYISEACNIPLNTVKHWRASESRRTKAEYDKAAAKDRLLSKPTRTYLVVPHGLPKNARRIYDVRGSENTIPTLCGLYELQDLRDVRSALRNKDFAHLNKIRLSKSAFFCFAYDFFLTETIYLSPALCALLLVYLRWREPYETIIQEIAGDLPESAAAYYRWAFNYLIEAARQNATWKGSDDYLLQMLSDSYCWLTSTQYEGDGRLPLLQQMMFHCKIRAEESGVVFCPESDSRFDKYINGLRVLQLWPIDSADSPADPCRRVLQELIADDTELCEEYISNSSLGWYETLERIFAFNSFALSEPDPNSGERILAFTRNGDFACEFSYLKDFGGMPLRELLSMVASGLLCEDEHLDEAYDLERSYFDNYDPSFAYLP